MKYYLCVSAFTSKDEAMEIHQRLESNQDKTSQNFPTISIVAFYRVEI